MRRPTTPSPRCSNPRRTTSPTASACTSPPASPRSTKAPRDFETHEERYDYAISLLNQGHYEDAREHFKEILLKEKSADYAFYGLALLASMTGDNDTCIEHLTEAIRLNARTASRPASTPTSTASPKTPASPNSSTPKSDRPCLFSPSCKMQLTPQGCSPSDYTSKRTNDHPSPASRRRHRRRHRSLHAPARSQGLRRRARRRLPAR